MHQAASRGQQFGLRRRHGAVVQHRVHHRLDERLLRLRIESVQSGPALVERLLPAQAARVLDPGPIAVKALQRNVQRADRLGLIGSTGDRKSRQKSRHPRTHIVQRASAHSAATRRISRVEQSPPPFHAFGLRDST